jgi:hypothetical protein
LDHSITSSARASSEGGHEAACLGGLEVDHQLILGGVLHRQVARLLSLEDAISIGRCATKLLQQSTRRLLDQPDCAADHTEY